MLIFLSTVMIFGSSKRLFSSFASDFVYSGSNSEWIKTQRTIAAGTTRDFLSNVFFVQPHSNAEQWIKEHEKLWSAFTAAGLNTGIFGRMLNLAALRSNAFTQILSNEKETGQPDPTDLGFIPKKTDQATLEKCLNMIRMHAELYQKGMPRITDFEYDLLKRKVHRLMNDPKKICTDEVLEAYSIPDLAYFFLSVQKKLGKQEQKFLFLPAIKGIYFHVKYQNGFLQEAFTSDFGEKRIDLTDLIRTMPGIPKFISTSGLTTVSGSLFIDTRDLHSLNIERRNAGQKCWTDTRSAIAHALLHAEEPNKALELKLKCYFDNVVCSENNSNQINTLSDVFKYLSNKHFPIIPRQYVEKGYLEKTLPIALTLVKLPFESPGIMIRVDDLKDREHTSPKDCLFKFMPQFRETKVDRIEFKGLSSGTVVAVVHVQPVQIAGKTVNNFLINNAKEFELLNIRRNGTITVYSFPNMQPRILKSDGKGSSDVIEFPSHCPKCSSTLTKINIDGEIASCCSTHLSCASNNVKDMAHFASICGLNIPSLSNNVILELMNKFVISSVSDIFSLSIADYDLLENIPFNVFERLLLEIKAAQNTTLERFIYALNIPSVTYLMAEELAYASGTIKRLSKMSTEELLALNSIDKEAAKNIVSFFSDRKRLNEIAKLLDNGVTIAQPNQEIMELCYKELPLYNIDEYKKIVEKIQYCNSHYAVTDFEFDLLNKAAQKIENLHPEWTLSRLPRQAKRELVSWTDPLFSMQKTYSQAQLQSFFKKTKTHGIIVEPKVNGVACALQYQNGVLVRALNKHDAKQAHDITDYVENIPNIPKKLAESFSGEIRGELFISDQDFKKLNLERKRSGLEVYIDSLSVLTGSLKKKEKNLQVYEGIQFFGYHLTLVSDHSDDGVNDDDYQFSNIKSRTALHEYIKKLGFVYDFGAPISVFDDTDAAIKYAVDVESRRHEFSTDIDGMVLKTSDLTEENVVQYAYKFKSETRSSRIASVQFGVTKGGLLSVVANIKPVKFPNGRVVSRLYLGSPKAVSELCEGDEITVNYSGGTTPVLGSIMKEKRKPNMVGIKIPENCPGCHKSLYQQKCGTMQCKNPRCIGPDSSSSLLRFAEILHIGRADVIKKLIEFGIVSKISDFYKILPEEIYDGKILSDEATQEFFASVEKSKNASIEELLVALNIRKVGKQSAGQIAQTASSFQDLSKMTVEDLCAKGIQLTLAKDVVDYFTKNSNEIEQLIQFGEFNPKNQDGKKETNKKSLDLIKMFETFSVREDSVLAMIRSALEIVEKSTIETAKNLIELKASSPTDEDKDNSKKLQYLLSMSQKRHENYRRYLEKYIASFKGPQNSKF